VADILDSLGHKYVQARSQEDARRLIAAKRYSYYLLDLELPVRTDRGFPRIQTGENLLGEIVNRQGEEKAPIIVMTGHGLYRPDLAVRVMKKGAVDYVKKPFPSTGNTLDRAILEVLSSRKTETGPKCCHPRTTTLARITTKKSRTACHLPAAGTKNE
jgi:DNA-binding NtrC family response regulator